MAHTVEHEIQNPGHLKASTMMTGVFGMFVVVGLIAFFTGYSADPKLAWASILRSHFYFMGISMAALFFVAIHWITTSMWSSTVRRIAEAFTSYLPFVLFSSLLVFLGAKHLYIWTHPEIVKGDIVLEGKQGYLNLSAFVIRALIAVVGWILFSKKIVGGSISVDNGANSTQVYGTNRKVGIGFLVFFALSFTMIAFDQLMSLDPHWFSTMFGVYIFAGSYQSFFSLLAIVTIIMRRTGYLKGIITNDHIHDIAKLMKAFTIFWAYTGFSQYMLLWYANLPEETGWFLLRFNPGWEFYTISLFVAKFIIPFLILLPRGNKRSEEIVFMVAVWILGTQYMDLNWLIQPEFRSAGPHLSFTDVGVWLGFLGVFGLIVTNFLQKHNVLAFRDPYLKDSVFHHHVQ